MKQLTLHVGVLTIALASFARAQATGEAPVFRPQLLAERTAWPVDFPYPDFRRVVSGEFTGDGLRDVMTLSSDSIVLSRDIAFYSAHMTMPVSGTDIDTAPAGGSDGRDALAVVSSSSTGFDLVFATTTNPLAFTYERIADSDWVNPTVVRSAQIDGAYGPDFVGVCNGGTKVVCRLAGGSSSLVISTSDVALDLGLLQWDTDAALELAVLTQHAVAVYDVVGALAGQQIVSFANAGASGGAMTVIKALSTRDRIAYIYPSSGTQVLTVLRAGASPAPLITLPAGIDAYAVRAGDCDSDGRNDLVIAHHVNYAPLFLRNEGGPGVWFTAPSTWTDKYIDDDTELATHAATGAHAAPVVDDLDADGTTDLLIAVDAIQNSATGLPGHVMLAGIPPSSANGPAPIAFIDGYLEDGGQNSTTNAFVRIDPANIPALANATHYELTIWRQVDTPLSLDPAVVSYTRHPVVAGQPTLALKVRLPWPSTTPKSCFGANTYWFDLRRIVFDNNAITAGGARCFGGFAGDYDKIVAMRTNETMYSYIASAVPIVNFPETLGQLAAACTTIAPSDGTTPTPIIINRRKPPPVPQNPQMPALTSGSTYNYPPPPP